MKNSGSLRILQPSGKLRLPCSRKKVGSLLSKEIQFFPVVTAAAGAAILVLFDTAWKIFKMEG